MKNQFKNIIIFTFFCTYLNSSTVEHAYTYVVKTSYDTKDQIELVGNYKGDILNLKDGIDFLTETELIPSFALIITTEPPLLSLGKIAHLERNPEATCVWYDLSWEKDGSKIAWSITKRDAENMPPRIPDTSIIIYCDPEFVEKIEDKVDQELSHIIHLPTIVMKKNLSPEEKKRRDAALERSALARIEHHNCTTQVKKVVQHGNRVKIARTR